MLRIPFNKPFLCGKELDYIQQAVQSGKISGDGQFSKKCQDFFESHYRFMKCLLTTSCTDALEMAAILCNLGPADEVILPSFTFVSTANPFLLRGARLRFCDSDKDHPNMSLDCLEKMITDKTKAVVIVHYGGVALDMDRLMALKKRHGFFLIEDCAHAIDSRYNGKPLGSFGELSTFSFHETKNIISGEGGLLAINDVTMVKRAEIIREKGTNRAAFFRGEIDKYNWIDIGSSFLPSEVVAAFLYAQLEKIDLIQSKRQLIWQRYHSNFATMEAQFGLQLPSLPSYATNNAHVYYLVCKSLEQRTALIETMMKQSVNLAFHYQTLSKSPMGRSLGPQIECPQSDRYSDCLVRLPLYYEMTLEDVDFVSENILSFFKRWRDTH
jgi:dTDP-4-amino-4,6-dideoxygalactose transaminase